MGAPWEWDTIVRRSISDASQMASSAIACARANDDNELEDVAEEIEQALQHLDNARQMVTAAINEEE